MISEGRERRVLEGVPREQKMLKGYLLRFISPSILVLEDDTLSILGPTQSHESTSILEYTKIDFIITQL